MDGSGKFPAGPDIYIGEMSLSAISHFHFYREQLHQQSKENEGLGKELIDELYWTFSIVY